jgi:hypothetical protein
MREDHNLYELIILLWFLNENPIFITHVFCSPLFSSV